MEQLYKIEMELQTKINTIYAKEAKVMKKNFLERIKDLF